MNSSEMIDAAKGPKFGSIASDVRRKVVEASLLKAFGLKGLPKPDIPELITLVNEVDHKIDTTYREMTTQELCLLLEYGISGELGRETRMCGANVFGWMSLYMQNEQRREALKAHVRNMRYVSAVNRDTLSQEDIDVRNRLAEQNGFSTLQAEYNRTGKLADDHFDGFVAMVFDGALKSGWIKYDDGAKQRAMLLAKKEQESRKAKKLTDGSLVMKAKKHLLMLCFEAMEGDLPY